MLIYSPIKNKSPAGAVCAGTAVTYTVTPAENTTAVMIVRDEFRGTVREYPLVSAGSGSEYTCEVTFEMPGLYFYSFEIHRSGGTLYGSCGRFLECEIADEPGKPWQQTVYADEILSPSEYSVCVESAVIQPKMRGGVMYQIFPDRFFRAGNTPPHTGLFREGAVIRDDWGGLPEFRPVGDKILNNDFFGGNIPGIIAKLDYLDSLGVTLIYLNPIFEARSNHKYDTCDFLKIDPGFGSEEDFRRLIKEAAVRGMGIVLDIVLNHTGDDSVYFNKYGRYPGAGAYQSADSPYRDWYCFRGGDSGGRIDPDNYDCWWDVKILPKLNQNSKSYVDFITGENGVLKKYMDMGIAGIRLDVVDELGDDFLDRVCKRVRICNPGAVLIGEVWEDATNKISYGKRRRYLLGGQLGGVMNYPLRDAIIAYAGRGELNPLLETLFTQLDHYPKTALHSMMNILGTHDTARILTVLGGRDCGGSREERSMVYMGAGERAAARKRLRIASAILYTVYGVPCVYYGDEAGMDGQGDPFNRRCYPWSGEDKGMISHFRALGKLRGHEVFREGDMRLLAYCGRALAYERSIPGTRIIAAFNRGSERFVWQCSGNFRNAFSGEPCTEVNLGGDEFVVLVEGIL